MQHDASSSRPQTPTTPSAATPAQRADQINYRFLVKLVLLLGQARLTHEAQRARRMDKWFNIETPDTELFRDHLQHYRSLSAAASSLQPTTLSVYVTLNVPDLREDKVLVYNPNSDQPVPVTPTPRAVVLEEWKVSFAYRPDDAVSLATVYKQAISLVRSCYSLLCILPANKLQSRLTRRRGPATLSLSPRLELGDGTLAIDSPLSLHQPAPSTSTHTLTALPTPYGPMTVSVRYKTTPSFQIDDRESILSNSDFVNAASPTSSAHLRPEFTPTVVAARQRESMQASAGVQPHTGSLPQRTSAMARSPPRANPLLRSPPRTGYANLPNTGTGPSSPPRQQSLADRFSLPAHSRTTSLSTAPQQHPSTTPLPLPARQPPYPGTATAATAGGTPGSGGTHYGTPMSHSGSAGSGSGGSAGANPAPAAVGGSPRLAFLKLEAPPFAAPSGVGTAPRVRKESFQDTRTSPPSQPSALPSTSVPPRRPSLAITPLGVHAIHAHTAPAVAGPTASLIAQTPTGTSAQPISPFKSSTMNSTPMGSPAMGMALGSPAMGLGLANMVGSPSTGGAASALRTMSTQQHQSSSTSSSPVSTQPLTRPWPALSTSPPKGAVGGIKASPPAFANSPTTFVGARPTAGLSEGRPLTPSTQPSLPHHTSTSLRSRPVSLDMAGRGVTITGVLGAVPPGSQPSSLETPRTSLDGPRPVISGDANTYVRAGSEPPESASTGTSPSRATPHGIVRRFVSSFGHRYASTSTSPAPAPGLLGGVNELGILGEPGSEGSGLLVLAPGTSGRETPDRASQSFLSTPTVEDEISNFLEAIDNRRPLRDRSSDRTAASPPSDRAGTGLDRRPADARVRTQSLLGLGGRPRELALRQQQLQMGRHVSNPGVSRRTSTGPTSPETQEDPTSAAPTAPTATLPSTPLSGRERAFSEMLTTQGEVEVRLAAMTEVCIETLRTIAERRAQYEVHGPVTRPGSRSRTPPSAGSVAARTTGTTGGMRETPIIGPPPISTRRTTALGRIARGVPISPVLEGPSSDSAGGSPIVTDERQTTAIQGGSRPGGTTGGERGGSSRAVRQGSAGSSGDFVLGRLEIDNTSGSRPGSSLGSFGLRGVTTVDLPPSPSSSLQSPRQTMYSSASPSTTGTQSVHDGGDSSGSELGPIRDGRREGVGGGQTDFRLTGRGREEGWARPEEGWRPS